MANQACALEPCTSGQSKNMPSVELDNTVADLCRTHSITEHLIAMTHCVFAQLDLHPEIPRESVYPEDGDSTAHETTQQDADRMRKITLALEPIRRAFGLGRID